MTPPRLSQPVVIKPVPLLTVIQRTRTQQPLRPKANPVTRHPPQCGASPVRARGCCSPSTSASLRCCCCCCGAGCTRSARRQTGPRSPQPRSAHCSIHSCNRNHSLSLGSLGCAVMRHHRRRRHWRVVRWRIPPWCRCSCCWRCWARCTGCGACSRGGPRTRWPAPRCGAASRARAPRPWLRCRWAGSGARWPVCCCSPARWARAPRPRGPCAGAWRRGLAARTAFTAQRAQMALRALRALGARMALRMVCEAVQLQLQQQRQELELKCVGKWQMQRGFLWKI